MPDLMFEVKLAIPSNPEIVNDYTNVPRAPLTPSGYTTSMIGNPRATQNLKKMRVTP
ncbi:hypothetical protein [Xanthomonas graminis]|uniref:hypothetical protein n=1 Tax=Xanthomonas graminis TaxID=3390026 RepID=UPI0018C86AAC|nr:hypothetical protein [Xanthomonas translucens]